MFNLSEELGVKSITFRQEKDPRAVASLIRQCSCRRTDISGCHVDYDHPDTWPAVLEAFRGEGIAITGNGVVQCSPDTTANRRFFEFARLAKSRLVSVNFPPEEHEATIRSITKLCEEFGIPAAIHNHGGKHWLGSFTMVNYILNRSPEWIGLCFDTAWCIQAGGKPLEWLDAFGGRLRGIHFKDFIFERSGQWINTAVGEGSMNLSAVLNVFRRLNFDGSICIEYEGDSPLAATRKSAENIRRCNIEKAAQNEMNP